MEQDLARIGVSLPENLLERFDEIITKRGYSSRSEGIRDAIRGYIRYYAWMSEVEGERVGTISLVYDHNQRGLVNSLLDIEHEFTDIIRSSIHMHINHDMCMEVLMVRGEGKDVKAVTEKIMTLRGVKHVKLTTIIPDEEI
ncbi:MAG: nickel responsive regulator [Candidatus Methanoperedens nitroreducens]|jgi:CopG family transcriptional regulator, nickel-responsive regulator|uniref:Putative nickel-responsive regulator n=1 Tax=Candidatus Methanoperedens nitratireducens TaxID=1392998 RepID=A0A0P8A383_9EURY|nr:nickel-responsive transcriptional regulator NikR [Candidatus Methanoperedens sp. BLZ2]KAB2945638.1 MAG: nickel-responsive transcriptional regulator NikR [Candidatus Methanoperedens sp.]KPQ42583.1 MAG: nickel responsive regulator [Candidatus Methanoperedens sp. BLZ1]MBZ0177264.1 nickel-responsive transcriptional regulator NikR [Candidatus Methanoperedens nitroreducens]CAG0956890.1 Putative nickel-responsive regulator [Methanosarcinales archaeon]MCX9076856.1 nickel-responsive transcriptional 